MGETERQRPLQDRKSGRTRPSAGMEGLTGKGRGAGQGPARFWTDQGPKQDSFQIQLLHPGLTVYEAIKAVSVLTIADGQAIYRPNPEKT